MGPQRASVDHVWIAPDGTRVPRIRGGTTASLTQTHARFRNDDGSQTTASWLANEDANAVLVPEHTYRIRIQVDETAGGSSNNFVGVLRYSHNGGAYTVVDAASSVVRTEESPNITNDEATTAQLTAPTGTFEPGAVDDTDGAAGTTEIDIPAGGYTEIEWCFRIRGADVANGDTIAFRCYRSTNVLNSYAVTIQATVLETEYLGFNRENHQTARPTYAISSHAALSALVAAFGFPPQFLLPTPGGPSDADALGAPILLQYDGKVGPVFIPAPVVAPDLNFSKYDDWIARFVVLASQQPTGPWVPQHQDVEGAALDWTARYPDWLPPLRLRLEGFTTSSKPEHRESLDQQPSYPDLIWQSVLPSAAIPWLTQPVAPEHSIALDAAAVYPDLIWRAVLPEALRPWLSPSPQPEHTEALDARAIYPDRHWTIWPAALWPDRLPQNVEPITPAVVPDQWPPRYPDWFVPLVLRTGHQMHVVGSLEPLVPPVAPDLAWQPAYPDFARGSWLLRHLQPWWAAPVSLFPHHQTGGPSDAAYFAQLQIQYTSLVGPLRFSLPIQAEGPTWQSVVQHWLARRQFLAAGQQPATLPLRVFYDPFITWMPILQITDEPQHLTVPSGMTPGQG